MNNSKSFKEITAAELVNNINVGWNLGNSLDASRSILLNAESSVSEWETAWHNPVITKAAITAIKNAGFNAIRIPVSWAKCTDSNYNIRSDWMTRVTEIVNYAADNDFYIFLNTHHDETIFKFFNADMAESTKAFKKIWEQISANFKNYNEKLVFEALNEPRTIGTKENPYPLEWKGGTSEERSNLNIYYQLFVDTVRASGGNNEMRILMVNTYAASIKAITMDDLKIPNDSKKNKIIVSFHHYSPFDFAFPESMGGMSVDWSESNPADTEPITAPIDLAYNKFICKGFPVIIGEFGAPNKNNTAARALWAEFNVRYAKTKGIRCFWWDNGGDPSKANNAIFNRTDNTFPFPEIISGLIKGAS
jgi:endoglucanase